MKANLIERRELYVRCPECGDQKSHRISHVPVGANFGILYCKQCGTGIRGHVISQDDVEIILAGKAQEADQILLLVNPREVPQFLIVKVKDEVHDTEDDQEAYPFSIFDIREIAAVDQSGEQNKNKVKYTVTT